MMMNLTRQKDGVKAMRNRLINDATSLVKQPPGAVTLPDESLFTGGAQYRQPAESATVSLYGGRTKPQHLTRGGMRQRERLKRCRIFCRKSCRIIIIRWAETSEQYTSRYLKRRNPVILHDKRCKICEIWICCIYFLVSEGYCKTFRNSAYGR